MTDLQAHIHTHKWGSVSTNMIEKHIEIPINPCFEVQGSSKHLAYVTSHGESLSHPPKTTRFKDLLKPLLGITSSGINISVTECERQLRELSQIKRMNPPPKDSCKTKGIKQKGCT